MTFCTDGRHPAFKDALRVATVLQVTFARETLAARIPLKSSLMPDPLLLGLSEQDIADIAVFLMKSAR